MTIKPYEVGHYIDSNCNTRSNDGMSLYISKQNDVLLMNDDDLDPVYVFVGGKFAVLENVFGYKYFHSTEDEKLAGIRPATRSELKAAGLWDMVINKDDISCPEDELEEYLRLAEEDDEK
jgi:hypothetical protein